jgi:hypothetical protein
MGDVEGVAINRDYLKANKYITLSASKGYGEAVELLSKYGVDDAILIPVNSVETTYCFVDGYKLTASVECLKWIQLFCGLSFKTDVVAKEFSNNYEENFKSFQQLIDGVHILYADHIALMLHWGVRALMLFGIDTYDASSIMNECDDLSLLPRVPYFEEGIDRIDDRALKLNLETAYKKATRGRWVGGGFGTTIGGTIASSIKGAVTAGAMNVGSGILHGIGDSIVGAMNNAEIKNMEKKLFEKKDTKVEFCNAVRSACWEVADVIRRIIEKHTEIRIKALKGKIDYKGEKLSDIDDGALKSKINNNISADKIEYAYVLLIEKLRRQPIDKDTLKQLYQLTMQYKSGNDGEILKRYAGDFALKLG